MKTEAWQQYADAEVLARVSVRLIERGEKTAWDQTSALCPKTIDNTIIG
jgi:hypothetical protein